MKAFRDGGRSVSQGIGAYQDKRQSNEKPYKVHDLEGQVINGVGRTKVRCCRSRCGHDIVRRHTGRGSSGMWTLYFPCVDGGVPTALILTAVDVDRNGQFLARLDGSLGNLIRPKNLETDLLRVLIVCL